MIRDIRASNAKWLFFVDDNLFCNKTRAGKLLNALEKEDVRWFAQANIKIAKDTGLLQRAFNAGCRMLYFGVESLNKDSLRDKNLINNPEDYKRYFRNVREAGIATQASIIFGMDGDNVSVFNETVDKFVEWKVPIAMFFVLSPLPGTPLTRRMKDEGRLLHSATKWHLINQTTAHFKPSNMTHIELNSGIWEAYERFYAPENIIDRMQDWKDHECFDWISLLNGNSYNAIIQKVHPMFA